MMNKKFKDIFFDLDHTLWDFDKNSKYTFKKILNDNNINIDIDIFLINLYSNKQRLLETLQRK